MFRKTLIAAAAVATVTAAALVPTTASAKSFKHWGGPYWGFGFGFAIAAPLVLGGSCVRYYENRYGQIYKVYVC